MKSVNINVINSSNNQHCKFRYMIRYDTFMCAQKLTIWPA